MMTLAERLQQINEEAKAFMAANPGSWSSGLTADLNHWAEYGITTAEQLDDYLDGCVEREREKGNLLETPEDIEAYRLQQEQDRIWLAQKDAEYAAMGNT